MSSSGSIPLTINVEPQLKEDFIALCDRENISLTSAIQEYMRRSIDGGVTVHSPPPKKQGKSRTKGDRYVH